MSPSRALDGILAGDFNDPTNERLIYLSAAGLAVIGLGLLFGTLVWWRRGRQEHPALAPLEVMSTRSWANAADGDRRRKLEQVRLSGAAGSVEEPIVAPPVDLEALVRSVPEDFDDLREPSAVIAVPAAVAAEPVDGAEVGEPDAVDAEEAVEAEAAVEADADAEPVEVSEVEPDSVDPESKPEPEMVDPVPEPDTTIDADATSISTERPIVSSESPARVPADSNE